MTQSYRYLSSTNAYMPVASSYVISYARNPKDFPVNRIVQLVEAPAPTFFYWKIDRDQPARVFNVNDHLWADGADRPEPDRSNQFGFTTVQAFCKRYDFATSIGNQALALAQKQWKAKQVYLEGLAAQAMLGRSINVVNLLTTASNWPATNRGDANTLNFGAGTWDGASDDPASPRYNAIKKAVSTAVTAVFLQTNGRVKWGDLRLVVNPNLAAKMANTAEIHSYLKYSGAGVQNLTGNEDNYNERFGLPRRLYGVELVVEDTPYLNDLPTAGFTSGSSNRQFLWPDATAVLLSRPGAIDAQVGPSFSTVQVYWYENQMVSLEWPDPRNLKTLMSVVDQYVAVLPAGESGYHISNAL